jgi:hypothetical protein
MFFQINLLFLVINTYFVVGIIITYSIYLYIIISFLIFLYIIISFLIYLYIIISFLIVLYVISRTNTTLSLAAQYQAKTAHNLLNGSQQ